MRRCHIYVTVLDMFYVGVSCVCFCHVSYACCLSVLFHVPVSVSVMFYVSGSVFSNVSCGCSCFNHVSCFGYLLHSCVMSQLHFTIRYNKQNYVAHIVTFDGVFSSV